MNTKDRQSTTPCDQRPQGCKREPDPATMTRDELRQYLRSRATVSLWPFTGRALSLSRSATYGHLCRVSSSWLENVLFGE